MLLQSLFGLSLLQMTHGILRELYTTNAACRAQYCINPVFPALQDLPELQKQRWRKQNSSNLTQFMKFCGGAVNYNIALPLNAVNTSMQELVSAQDHRAAQTYFYHLSAMGIEPWDHTTPFEDSSSSTRSCARAVARMACFTYLPAAVHDLPDGAEVRYHRPCETTCQSFLETCGVECCDESTTCAWSASVTASLPELQAPGLDSSSPSTCCPPQDDASPQSANVPDRPRHTQDAGGRDVVLLQGYGPASEGLCTGM